MASEFNKKATIREIMYLVQQERDKKYEPKTMKDLIFIDEIPPMMSEETLRSFTLLSEEMRRSDQMEFVSGDRIPGLSSAHEAPYHGVIVFSDMDPRASCQHSHPMCDECLAKLGEEAGDISNL